MSGNILTSIVPTLLWFSIVFGWQNGLDRFAQEEIFGNPDVYLALTFQQNPKYQPTGTKLPFSGKWADEQGEHSISGLRIKLANDIRYEITHQETRAAWLLRPGSKGCEPVLVPAPDSGGAPILRAGFCH